MHGLETRRPPPRKAKDGYLEVLHDLLSRPLMGLHIHSMHGTLHPENFLTLCHIYISILNQKLIGVNFTQWLSVEGRRDAQAYFSPARRRSLRRRR